MSGLTPVSTGAARSSLEGDEPRAFVVRAVNELAEQILTGEAAPTGAPESAEDELASRGGGSHGEAVTMGELANRLDDTPHNTVENRAGVPALLTIGERSRWLTEVSVDGGAGVPHLRAGPRR